MAIVKVRNNRIQLMTNKGRLLRSIGTGIDSADYNPTMEKGVAVKTDGNVILFDKNGRIVRTLTKGANRAVFSGDDVVVTMENGKIELRRLDGSLIRSI